MKAYLIFVGNQEGKRPLVRPDVNGRTIIKLILERENGVVWTALFLLQIGTNEGLL
jgi:hypothetical protein